MKILMINGSPHVTNGSINRAFLEMKKVFEKVGAEVVQFNIGTDVITGCRDCGYCHRLKQGCVIKDKVNEIGNVFKDADALVVGSPVYFSSPNGSLISLLDRLFYSASYKVYMKVGASVVACRRGGNSSTFDILNKYFLIRGMPVAPSTYWNMVHGYDEQGVNQDEEGLQTMRNLARNIIFMVNAIKNERERSGLPEVENGNITNFIEK